jgi:glycosyltransferase involved in cell wall biosynthesis
MHIGIDGNEANQRNRVGIGQFAYQILTQLHQIDQKNHYTIYLNSRPLSDLPKETKNWTYRVFGPTKFWTQWRLPLDLYLSKNPPDLFFSPSHYSPRFSPIPTVSSIMDLSYFHYPDQFTPKDLYQLKNWTAYSVKKATKIITISHFSKKEIQKFYKIPTSKITVAHLASDHPLKPPTNKQKQDLLKKFSIQKPFFLYLGTLKPNKNIPFLIRSFHSFSQKNPAYQLVIAGKKGWHYKDIFQTVKDLKLQKKVIFTDFISEKEKWTLLSLTQAFILPSLYEGFGIPVLEAMSIGTPVICSNNSSLPEVSGESALTFNPSSSQELKKAMQKITNPKVWEKYSHLGPFQTQKFSWTKTARTVLRALKSVY